MQLPLPLWMTAMPRGANLVVVVVGSSAQCRHSWVERETRRPRRFGQYSKITIEIYTNDYEIIFRTFTWSLGSESSTKISNTSLAWFDTEKKMIFPLIYKIPMMMCYTNHTDYTFILPLIKGEDKKIRHVIRLLREYHLLPYRSEYILNPESHYRTPLPLEACSISDAKRPEGTPDDGIVRGGRRMGRGRGRFHICQMFSMLLSLKGERKT